MRGAVGPGPDIASPTYPEDEELDALAPDLQRLIDEQIDERQELPMRRHMDQRLSSMSHDIIHSLPEEQQERTARRMREEEAPTQG